MATKTKTRKPAAAAKRKTTTATKRSTASQTKRPSAKPAARKTSTAKRKVSSKRELIKTGTDKRYVRRRTDGTFKESDDVGRSLSADRRRKAATKAKRGQGDRGD